MSIASARLPVLAFTFTLALAGGGTDDDAKQVHVDNQADVHLRVAVGATDFGTVAAATVSPTQDVADGALEVKVDGVRFDQFELGSDNVVGVWTLTLDRVEAQPGQYQIIGGITADQ
jgi:hypothetical protein